MDKTLGWLLDNGLLIPLVEQYIKSCAENTVLSDKKKDIKRFPNLAGFCRSIGIGTDSLYELEEKHPDEYSLLCAIFEDEALNSLQSPTVISAYMKERLRWGEGEKARGRSSLDTDEGLTLIFEHDIEEDGA